MVKITIKEQAVAICGWQNTHTKVLLALTLSNQDPMMPLPHLAGCFITTCTLVFGCPSSDLVEWVGIHSRLAHVNFRWAGYQRLVLLDSEDEDKQLFFNDSFVWQGPFSAMALISQCCSETGG